MSGAIIALIVLGIAVLLALWAIAAYNGLVRLRREVENAWSQIDVQLKRRFDLIPNLVETVKGYAAHERSTLEALTLARSRVQEARSQGPAAQIAAEGALSQALRGLFVQVEAYPDLKANANFAALQEELTSTENRIAFARQAFNDAATRYNTRIETFPDSIIAGAFAFRPRDLWTVTDAVERETPRVRF